MNLVQHPSTQIQTFPNQLCATFDGALVSSRHNADPPNWVMGVFADPTHVCDFDAAWMLGS